MPWCDTDAMAAHLIEISAAVDPGAHAVLIVDQAGWHLTPKLAIPDNITVLALPPRSPELNPVENVWQFMRDNWLSNRIFKSYARHRRAVLPSLEQPHRPTMEDHVPRHAQMGAWVLINDRWYYTSEPIEIDLHDPWIGAEGSHTIRFCDEVDPCLATGVDDGLGVVEDAER